MASPDAASRPAIDVFPDREQLIRHAADRLVAHAARVIGERGRLHVALSGGSTPLPLYRLLGMAPDAQRIDWSRIHIFFVDERCVPPQHPDSNFRGLTETLLGAVQVPRPQVYRMRGEDEPSEAAAAYEALLRRVFPAPPDAPPSRTFDLVLLGMGEDGHTASLFPDAQALQETRRWVVDARAPAPPHERLTLTLPVLNAAQTVWFLVAGKNKASAVEGALAGRSDARLPASLVHPSGGAARWLLDADAAARLRRKIDDRRSKWV